MNAKRVVGTALLGLAIFASAPLMAQGTRALTKAEFTQLDSNKDGRLSKDEFMAGIGKVFDEHAGAKGYCTMDEAAAVMRKVQDYSYLEKSSP